MMRWSAGLVTVGLVLLVLQVSFSDGAVPIIVSLPIGIWPLVGGLASVGAGLLLGLVGGTPRYRAAALLALLGTFLAAFGLLFIHSRNPSAPAPAFTVNDGALVLAAVAWGSAIAIGLNALRATSHTGSAQRGPGPGGM